MKQEEHLLLDRAVQVTIVTLIDYLDLRAIQHQHLVMESVLWVAIAH